MEEAIHPVWHGATTSGAALTVHAGYRDNLALNRTLDTVTEGEVIVVDAGGAAFGYWGEGMSKAVMQNGAAGLVIEGGIRDTSQIEDLQFPVFAKSRSIESSAKSDPGEIGVPVTVGGTDVASGDWVVADAAAVVILPPADLEQVMATARQVKEREEEFEEIVRGQSTLD